MSKRGWRAWTVLPSRSRSLGASNRSVGAVITSTGRDRKSTSAAEQIPSKRRRTTARESSAGKSSTGPVRGTAKRRRQGVPEATLTARSRARKLLQHLGSPPENAHGLVGPQPLDQPLGERSRVDGKLAGALDRQLVHERLQVGLGSREKTSKKSFSSIWSRSW